ncbi:MAG: ROK family protein [Bacteroidota bacterium]
MAFRTEKPGTPSTIQTINRRLVLELVRRSGPISRTDIARRLGTTGPTVSNAVKHLMRKELVVARYDGPSTGGRRPILLGFNEQAGYVLALNIGAGLDVGLFDLGGSAVGRLKDELPKRDGQRILEQSMELVIRLVKKADIPHHRIWAMGISAPGIVDPDSGTATHAPLLGPGTWPLGHVFAKRFQVPVLVDNDVNAAAFGEKLRGAGRAFDDFVYILMDEGIGAGIMLRDGLYRGSQNAAGEIGYMVTDPDWVADNAGGFGCLESVASVLAIRRLATGLGLAMSAESQGNLALGHLLRTAKGGDDAARRIADRVLKFIAMGVANLCAVLNPSTVILGGANVDELVLEELKPRLEGLIPKVPPIVLSALGADASLVGAASLAIDHVVLRALDDDFSPESSFVVA